MKKRLLYALLLTVSTVSNAWADWTYSFTGGFGSDASTSVQFTVLYPNAIATAGEFTPANCVSDGAACATTQTFDPDAFGTGHAFIGLNVAGATYYYFFDPGVFLAEGTYLALTDPLPGSGPFEGNYFGSAGPAQLEVSNDPTTQVPAPATLALLGFGLAGLGAARRLKK